MWRVENVREREREREKKIKLAKKKKKQRRKTERNETHGHRESEAEWLIDLGHGEGGEGFWGPGMVCLTLFLPFFFHREAC